MKAIAVTDKAAGTAGTNYGDVVVQVHASGFTGDELNRCTNREGCST
jgi:hypothetical protein